MFKSIVFATDGSASADRALPYARALLDPQAGSLFVVHCKETMVGPGTTGLPVFADEDELEAKIERQVADLTVDGVDATLRIENGRAGGAAQVIAEVAEQVGAEVIVVGTRGHTTLAGLLLGSVTERLLHIGACPVFAVPAGVQRGGATSGAEQAAATA
jgi:nucleotide-binding universal stress UspA family protein